MSGGKPRERRHGLERRAGRVGPAGGAVEEGLRRVVRKAPVERRVERRHEVVRVVAGRAREDEDVARARVERDAGPGAPRELALGDALELGVEREAQVKPLLRLLDGLRADRVAVRVDRERVHARHAAQVAVVVGLQAGAAAQLRLEEVELLAVGRPVAVAVASDVAEELRGERAERIRPHLLRVDGEAGVVALALGEGRELALGESAPDDERNRAALVDVAREGVRRRPVRPPEVAAERGDRLAHRLRRPGVAAPLEARGVADERRREAALREDVAVAVEDAAAHPRRPDAPLALAARFAPVVRRVLDLELAELHAEPHEADGEEGRERPAGHEGDDVVSPVHRAPPPFPPR